jgi:hypothetical protein
MVRAQISEKSGQIFSLASHGMVKYLRLFETIAHEKQF